MSRDGLRRTLHAASASVLLLTLVSDSALKWGTAALFLLAIGFEGVRLGVPGAHLAIAARLPVYRPRERSAPSGGAWLAAGFAAAAWMPAPGPAVGILAGALADPAAAWVGCAWGRGAPKSWAGTATAALVAGLAALAVTRTPIVALAAGLAAAVLERWSGPLDDNLIIAPGVAGVAGFLA